MRWFDTAAILVACSAIGSTAYAQQRVHASPSVADKACSLGGTGTGTRISNLASPDSTVTATSSTGSGTDSLRAETKLICYAKVSYSLPSFLGPVFAASKKMISPPQAYPSE